MISLAVKKFIKLKVNHKGKLFISSPSHLVTSSPSHPSLLFTKSPRLPVSSSSHHPVSPVSFSTYIFESNIKLISSTMALFIFFTTTARTRIITANFLRFERFISHSYFRRIIIFLMFLCSL